MADSTDFTAAALGDGKYVSTSVVGHSTPATPRRPRRLSRPDEEVLFNGKLVDMYHYGATPEYPSIVGCYEGASSETTYMPRGDAPQSRAAGSTRNL